MGKISGFRHRVAFTLVEEVVVVAIILLLALPITYFFGQFYAGWKLNNEQLMVYLVMDELVMDFEKYARQAAGIEVTEGNPRVITITYPETESGKTVIYKLYNPGSEASILYKEEGGESQVFPPGLENGLIRDFKIYLLPPQQVMVTIESASTIDNNTESILKKTIYVINSNQ